jgi:hypothetical protein
LHEPWLWFAALAKILINMGAKENPINPAAKGLE